MDSSSTLKVQSPKSAALRPSSARHRLLQMRPCSDKFCFMKPDALCGSLPASQGWAREGPSRPLCLILFSAVLSAASGQPVDIPDPGLQAAIREALNQPTGDLTVELLQSLTSL